MFSKDTSQLCPDKPWEEITDLGAYSLFVGLNYPLNIAVGGGDSAPGCLTRSNCVYTSHHAIGLGYRPFPKIIRFGVNCKESVFGFSTNVEWANLETPIWFNPSFANTTDWNILVTGLPLKCFFSLVSWYSGVNLFTNLHPVQLVI